MGKLMAMIKREMSLLCGGIGRLLSVLLFFIIVATLYVFSAGVDSHIYQLVGVGILWISAFLAVQLSASYILQHDYDDGTLELYWLHALLPEVIIGAKIIAYWIILGGLITLLSPILIILLQLPTDNIFTITWPLALGLLGLLSLNTLGAVLTLGARQASLLQPLIILPLTVPLLIFGVGASQGNVQACYVMAGLTILYTVIAIIMGAMALTVVVRDG